MRDTSQKTISSRVTVMAKENASRDKQREFANLYLEKPLKLGDKWYIINKNWFDRWSAYIGLDKSGKMSEIPPEKINNQSLLSNGSRLKENLMEGMDFVTVPQEMWNYLVDIYSVESDEDMIEREVIDDSIDGFEDDTSNLKIEIRRLQVQMECAYEESEPAKHVQEMSRQTKIDSIIELMKKHFKVPADKQVQIYYRPPIDNPSFTKNMMTQVNPDKKSTLLTTSYAPDDTIVMRVIGPDEVSTCCSRPHIVPPAPALPANTSMSQPSTRYSTHMTTRNQSFGSNGVVNDKRGLCGLSNLGNTCFMNSALQCMSNVPLLTDYFLTQRYKPEINTVNPLGRHGEIAEAYANLIADIWSGSNSYVIPRQFKLAISKFAPQFTGYQQQDSQELLAFLLDGLHEDLNRVLKKPYVELGSHVGKTDEEFAEQSWQDHKKRNDSIIVDIFHGLLKSTLNCLVCNEISIKFDPFCYLSVPLPSKKERLIEVVFVPIDTNQPLIKCKLAVLKQGSVQDLCASMENLLEKDASITNKVPRSRMVVCDVYSNKFFKIFEPNELVDLIKDRDSIYIYELQSNLNNPDFLKIKLHLREKTSAHSVNPSGFGLPLFFMVPKENLTYGSLYQYCLKYLKRFLKNPPNTNEEINSKLNNSLNVNDEEPIASIDQDVKGTNGENSNDESDDEPDTRKPAKKPISKKPFSLHVSSDNYFDHDSSSTSSQISDETLFKLPTTTSHSFGSYQIVSLDADFTPTSVKSNYKVSRTSESGLSSDLFVEHSSCQTTQLSKQRRDVITLADCFMLYTKMEELSGQDYWYCSKCKAHQASTKKFDLWKLPPVLVVHLKRFSYNRSFRDKIDTLVDFPLTDLDMAPYLINKNAGETRYSLIGVSNHYGSLGGGHYTAYGKNRCDGKWYYFDDSSVSSSDESSVCTPAAYMLIYLRKDLHDSNFGSGSLNPSSWSQMEDEIYKSSSSGSEKMDH